MYCSCGSIGGCCCLGGDCGRVELLSTIPSFCWTLRNSLVYEMRKLRYVVNDHWFLPFLCCHLDDRMLLVIISFFLFCSVSLLFFLLVDGPPGLQCLLSLFLLPLLAHFKILIMHKVNTLVLDFCFFDLAIHESPSFTFSTNITDNHPLLVFEVKKDVWVLERCPTA
jgi:hypothetical protein